MAFDTGYGFERMSGKTLAILGAVALGGAIILIQFIQGFPIKDYFKAAKSEVVSVTTKYDQTCVVTPSDEHPREIHNCSYVQGQNLTITYNPNSANVISVRPIQ